MAILEKQVRAGLKVKLGRHQNREYWIPNMDRFVGRITTVLADEPSSPLLLRDAHGKACVRVEADGGSHRWRIENMTIVGDEEKTMAKNTTGFMLYCSSCDSHDESSTLDELAEQAAEHMNNNDCDPSYFTVYQETEIEIAANNKATLKNVEKYRAKQPTK